jgi:superfamily II DNA/RNA helicase
MNDSFDVAGDFSPAAPFSSTDDTFVTETLLSEVEVAVPADAVEAAEADQAPEVPNGFVTLGLAPELVQAVADLGYTQPTAVQMQTIPMAMQSESSRFVDLMVSSQTGSGKTAAFLLPVLHTLLKQQAEAEAAEKAEFDAAVADAAAKGEPAPKRAKRKDPTSTRNFKAATPGALILCPTRELAQQVAHDAIGLVQHCRGLRIANVVGGMPYQLQIAKLQNANLVVATPGRLLDLQRSQQIKLDQVQFLVVDEADRMLDLGFSDDLADVNQMTIGRKQTMMFSATFAPRIQQLAQRVMREPQRVTIDSPQEKHQNIKQILFWADNAQHKRKLLDHWLRDTTIAQAIVFASTQIECDGLANDLQQEGFSAVALHGALSQGLRNRRLMALRQGQVQILVATDVAARGIDVPSISHVFNFGLPMKAEDYTHRIGRTGRAGRDGIAVTFAEMRDRRKIFDIESYSHQQFKAEVIPGMEPQQRQPDSRPPRGAGGGFGGSRDGAPRGRSFGPSPRGNDRGGFGGNREGGGGGYGGASGFNDRNSRPPARTGAGGGYQGNRDNNAGSFGGGGGFGGGAPAGGGFGQRDDRGPRRGGNEGFSAPREDFAPRGDRGDRGSFGAARPAGKPAFSKPGAPAGLGGKVFVPRDAAKKRLVKPAR